MREHFQDSVLRRQWDETTRTYTAWDASGTQIEQRPFNAAENARADAEATQATLDANGSDLRSKASNALAANATFLAVASPTNAQTITQVQRLTRECNALIRLMLNQLDSTTGT